MRLVIALLLAVGPSLVGLDTVFAYSVNSSLNQQILQLDCTLTPISNGSGTVVTPDCPPHIPIITGVFANQGQPTITGLYDAAYGESLNISLNGVVYSLGVSGQLQATGNTWTLNLSQLSPPLLQGQYDIEIDHTLPGGETLEDSTTNELTILPYDVGLPTVSPVVSLDGRPVISGTFKSSHTDSLRITLAGQLYDLGVDPELTASGNTWQLDLTSLPIPLPLGSYNVMVRAVLFDGQVDEDTSTNELIVQRPDADAPTVDTITWVGGQPILQGSYDSSNSVHLRIFVADRWYELGSSPELSVQGDRWRLDLSHLEPPLSPGRYEVIAQATSRDGSIYGSVSGYNLTILTLTVGNVIKHPGRSPLASTGMNIHKLGLLIAMAILIILMPLARRLIMSWRGR